MRIEVLTAQQAAQKVKSGDSMYVGGFGMTGTPSHILAALAQTNVNDLTYISNNVGESGMAGSRMVELGMISKVVGSFFTSNPDVVRLYREGKIDVELIPQGTLAEAIRAGGAGIGGFFTPTAAGTELAKGKETRIIDGKEMVLIDPIKPDVSLIRAWKADKAGNLQYRLTENNFNEAAAMAGKLVIAEVEEIVEIGEIDPNFVHTPGCLVDVLVEAKLDINTLGTSASVASSNKRVDAGRMAMAQAALDELEPGSVVNLGIGIPTLVADLIKQEHDITLESENGMLGVGPEPESGGAMEYPVNAGKIPVTAMPGASYFDSAMSFALIRGGHIDAAIIGGLQVDEQANLANWAVPDKPVLGVGGAMDLASGAEKLIITMTHTDKDGNAKIVPSCTFPLTAKQVVDVIITDLAVFKFIEGKLTLVKLQPGHSLEEVEQKTTAEYVVALN
ncbi:MAG: 3-oxoacid CoA-transferase subunit B [Pseudohongiellaceae bacterium]|nr:3-oxoacid CoA-transferase subunit B [Pseudohongiellaceae bacterium]